MDGSPRSAFQETIFMNVQSCQKVTPDIYKVEDQELLQYKELQGSTLLQPSLLLSLTIVSNFITLSQLGLLIKVELFSVWRVQCLGDLHMSIGVVCRRKKFHCNHLMQLPQCGAGYICSNARRVKPDVYSSQLQQTRTQAPIRGVDTLEPGYEVSSFSFFARCRHT